MRANPEKQFPSNTSSLNRVVSFGAMLATTFWAGCTRLNANPLAAPEVSPPSEGGFPLPLQSATVDKALPLPRAVPAISIVRPGITVTNKPDLSDLNVAFISRTPRYPAYTLRYQKVPGSGNETVPYPTDPVTGAQITAAAEQQIKRGPAPGEEVTFTAMICNHGTQPTGTFNYTWYIDDKPVASGTHQSLNGPALVTDGFENVTLGGRSFKVSPRIPGTFGTVEYKWKWQEGRHYVSLRVDGDNTIKEICEINNSVTDAINAPAFVMITDAKSYNTLAQAENHLGSFNFDDILKYHREKMHRKFRESIHPLTPNGIVEEIRIDSIIIQPKGVARETLDPIKLPEGWDGHWDFTGYTVGETPEKRFWYTKDEDWGLIHELGHQLGLIDIYCLDTEGGDWGSAVPDGNGDPFMFPYYSGHEGMMKGHGDVIFDEHSATALNLQLDRRRGYYGDYLWCVPEKNVVRILDCEGKPLANARLNFHQAMNRLMPAEPVFSGVTDSNGEFVLPNRPCSNSHTENGFEIKPNPFGQINVGGGNGVFCISVNAAGRSDFAFLAITDFNLAYWRGETKTARFDLKTMLSATPGIRSLTLRQEWRGPEVELTCGSGRSGETFTMYERLNAPPRWAPVTGAVDLEVGRFKVRTGGEAIRRIVVGRIAGKVSSLSEEVRLLWINRPMGMALDSAGRRLVIDEKSTRPAFLRANNAMLGSYGSVHSHASGGGDLAVLNDGRTLIVANERAFRPILLLNAQGHLDGKGAGRFGQFGTGDFCFEHPVGVTVDSEERVWICDAGTGELQVLNKDLNRTLARMKGLSEPRKVVEVGGGIFAVADRALGRVILLTLDGEKFKTLSSYPAGRPVYLAARRDIVFVADNGDDTVAGKVYALRASAEKLTLVGTFNTGITRPYGLAWDEKQQVLAVADQATGKVENLSPKDLKR